MLVTKYYSGDEIKKREMRGGIWNLWEVEEVRTGLRSENLKKKGDRLEYLLIDGKIILKRIFNKP
jgi:hypothetical protein